MTWKCTKYINMKKNKHQGSEFIFQGSAGKNQGSEKITKIAIRQGAPLGSDLDYMGVNSWKSKILGFYLEKLHWGTWKT